MVCSGKRVEGLPDLRSGEVVRREVVAEQSARAS